MATLVIAEAGPQVSVQDRGRPGLMRFGVPASGPMDRAAARVAHAALGNAPDAPLIEVSVGGLTLDCTEGAAGFAVAGGGFRVTVAGQTLGPWCVGQIAAGQRLTIRPGRWGRWAYLAFAGGMQADRWLGSAATHAPSGLGGGHLVAGESVSVDDSTVVARRIACPVWARPRVRVRVVMGPQDALFDAAARRAFLTEAFRLTDAADRMGVRLAGPSLAPTAVLDMPSQAVLRGSVQVAGDGVATVLMADHQTTGGYPKIATVLSCDTDGFAQLRSHDALWFQAVTPDAAIAAARLHDVLQGRFLQVLAAPHGPAAAKGARD